MQTPTGIGFSDEGFPIGNFSGAPSAVAGLKRQAAAPGYSTNCFVGALGEAVDYQVTLFDGVTTAVLGAPITGHLVPFQSIRFLDIFAAVGAPAGDHVNSRASFLVTTPNAPAMVSYCTVQENNTFGADFRVAKSADQFDERQKRVVCFGQDTCGTVTADNPVQIVDAATKNIHAMFIEQPDYVLCGLQSPHLTDLQVRIRGPGDEFSSPVWPSALPFFSGGPGATGFYIFTGNRSTIANGNATRWFIDVGFRTVGGVAADLPVSYGITCVAGNGVSVPYPIASDPLDF